MTRSVLHVEGVNRHEVVLHPGYVNIPEELHSEDVNSHEELHEEDVNSHTEFFQDTQTGQIASIF